MRRVIVAALILAGMIMSGEARVNLNTTLNVRHEALFQSTARELLVYGGAGAGKSYSIADKLLLQAHLNPDRQRAVIVRRTLASIRKTTIDILERRAEALHIPLRVDKQSFTAQAGNMTFIMTGMNNTDDHQKIKSLTDVNFIWANELTELRETDYKELLLRLRGGRLTGRYAFRQIIGDFNPVGKTSWVYGRFWERLPDTAAKLRYTVKDNPWAEPEYIAQLEATAKDDLNFHKIYFLGEWGELRGVIYDWDVVPLPDLAFDEVFYGGDFGYSVNPSALVRIYRKADEFWLEEIIYQPGLTNQDLAGLMADRGVSRSAPIYFDCAEPKSIDEIYRAGFNARPGAKGPDSVRTGIDFLRARKVHVVEGSENIIREQKAYVWRKDKDDRPMEEPIQFNNHAMDAARYGIFTHCGLGYGFHVGSV